jgi:hypothetical protein
MILLTILKNIFFPLSQEMKRHEEEIRRILNKEVANG